MSDESKVIWQAESTNPELTEPLKEAFREVIDPEIGLNIIELGLIRDVVIEDDQARITELEEGRRRSGPLTNPQVHGMLSSRYWMYGCHYQVFLRAP